MTRTLVPMMSLLLLGPACGDDGNNPTTDAAIQLDRSTDLRPNADRALPDQAPPADQSLPADLPPADSGGPARLSGKVSVAPGASCGSSPDNDCKGTLYVGVVDQPVAPPASTLLGSQTLQAVDLAAGAVSFTIDGLSPGKVYLSAMLVESGQLPSPPLPVTGDLVVQPQPVTLLPGTNSADLQLDTRW